MADIAPYLRRRGEKVFERGFQYSNVLKSEKRTMVYNKSNKCKLQAKGRTKKDVAEPILELRQIGRFYAQRAIILLANGQASNLFSDEDLGCAW